MNNNIDENKKENNLIITALNNLFAENPIFVSEADFQFHLAWKIKETDPNVDVKLEYIPHKISSNMHVDIVVFTKDEIIPIELKYKTKKLESKSNNIFLKDHSAQDAGRYDFLSDIQRMECIVSSDKYPEVKIAYAIFLTNDDKYWKSPKFPNTNDAQFRIHEGNILHGSLEWASKTGLGTKKKRENPIQLKNYYEINWSSYTWYAANKIDECDFKYTLVEIKP